MEITTTTIHDLHWDFPNSQEFSAEITNGKITKLSFNDVGELTQSPLESINEKYLRNIHRALSGLFQHLDQIRGVGNLTAAEEENTVDYDERNRRLRLLQKDEKEMDEYKERVLNSINKV
ncbi:hypothetical protein GCM10023231_02900 [Olivibacter ginsenosidimutans]|uniref:Uncharacterized protein n=1 Tax=Olivibacter ginsenosidimutans TaxID=1176537 RepID=A0ABP9ADF5_9SPHI